MYKIHFEWHYLHNYIWHVLHVAHRPLAISIKQLKESALSYAVIFLDQYERIEIEKNLLCD